MSDPKPFSPPELPLDTTYAAEMFGRMARQHRGDEPSPPPEAIVEAALRQFMGEGDAMSLLGAPGQPLSKAGPSHELEARRDLARHLMREMTLDAWRAPDQAPSMASALVDILTRPIPSSELKTRQELVAEGLSVFQAAKAAGFPASAPGAATPLTEATLDFANEHWTPKALLFWEDPMAHLMRAARADPSPEAALAQFQIESQRRQARQEEALSLRRSEMERERAESSTLAAAPKGDSGSLDIGAHLMKSGADLSARDTLGVPDTALERAEPSKLAAAPKGDSGSLDIVAHLMKSGADLSARDTLGVPDTPFMRILDSNKSKTDPRLEALLLLGADPSASAERPASERLGGLSPAEEHLLANGSMEMLSALRSLKEAPQTPESPPPLDRLAEKVKLQREAQSGAPAAQNVKRRSLGE